MADAVSFLVSAASLLAIRRSEPRAAPPAEHGLAALLVGWRQVTRSPLLRPNTLYTASGNLVGSAFGTVLIVFEVRELGLSGLTIGLVTAVGSVGFLVGAMASRRLGQRLGIGPVICMGGILTGLGIGVMAAAPRALPIPVLVAGQLLLGGIALSNLQTMSLRQAITPDAVLGRVNATVRFLGFGTIPVGAAVELELPRLDGVAQAPISGTSGPWPTCSVQMSRSPARTCSPILQPSCGWSTALMTPSTRWSKRS